MSDTCPIHNKKLVCPSCRAAAAGRANKGKSSTRKRRASKKNGLLGGRKPAGT